MKTALFLFGLIPSLALAQVSDPAPAIIEGQVVSTTTGQPLRKVAMQLFRRGETTFGLGVISAMSDDNGRFKVENVAPGNYGLSGSRTGYVSESRFNTRSQTIKLGPGQRLSDILIKLTPQGVIAGSVLDEDGDPIPSAQVILYRERGSRTQMRPDQASNADAEGHFVLTGVTPGRYYVAAYQFQSRFQIQRTLNPEPQENYVLTYYPGSLDAASAVALDIAPGSEFRSVDIRMRKARTFRISGKVANWPTDSPAFTLSLIRVGGSEINGPTSSPVRQDSFEFNNVLPGSYVIRGTPRAFNERTGESRLLPVSCRFPVTVRDEDISGINIELRPATKISGIVRVEDGRVLDSAPSIMFSPIDGDSMRTARPDRDGTFELTNLGPDQYRVGTSQLPKEMYLKSIRAGGQEFSPSLLDLTEGDPGEIQILLSPKAADIRGTVRDGKGDLVPSASVALWSKGDRPPVSTISDENGMFAIGSLPPDDYYIAAQAQGDFGEPDPRPSSDALAHPLVLHEGSHETVDLTLAR
jgi:5-hydroxyisourate hydrolase-like protein (transthyretin family)